MPVGGTDVSRQNRAFTPTVDVRDFRIKMSSSSENDYTSEFNRAAAEAIASKGWLFIPKGYIYIAGYDLPVNETEGTLKIKGGGKYDTIIYPTTSQRTAFFDRVSSTGRSLNFCLWDIGLSGNRTATTPTNAGQFPVRYLSAAATDGNMDGGGWWWDWQRVGISRWDKEVYIRGGTDNFLEPMQFIQFTLCEFFYQDNDTQALVATGQFEHVDFLNCLFQGKGTGGSGTTDFLVTIGRDGGSGNAPKAVNFYGTGFNQAQGGIEVDNCVHVNINGCFIENLEQGIKSSASTSGVHIVNNYFATVGTGVDGGVGVGNGYLAENGATSTMLFAGNTVANASARPDYYVKDDSSNGTIIQNNFGNQPFERSGSVGGFSSITKQLSESSGTLDTQGHRTVFVNASATAIDTIVSKLSPGEKCRAKAHNGTISFNSSGGNVTGNGWSGTIVVPQDHWVTIERVTTIGTYIVTLDAGLVTDAYTTSNVITDRSFDANSTSLDEIADVLGTLIADLKTTGILQG